MNCDKCNTSEGILLKYEIEKKVLCSKCALARWEVDNSENK
jgi:hypothetical protein